MLPLMVSASLELVTVTAVLLPRMTGAEIWWLPAMSGIAALPGGTCQRERLSGTRGKRVVESIAELQSAHRDAAADIDRTAYCS